MDSHITQNIVDYLINPIPLWPHLYIFALVPELLDFIITTVLKL